MHPEGGLGSMAVFSCAFLAFFHLQGAERRCLTNVGQKGGSAERDEGKAAEEA